MLLAATLVSLGARAAPSGASAPANVWPEFHHGPSLSGASADPTISTANASQLGVRWMAPIGSSLASPMVAWNAALQETLAYVGTTAGYFDAVNVANGQVVWSDDLGSSLISSPLVEGGSVWIAPTGGGRVFKLDAATGATSCSGAAGGSILSTPVIATPPGGAPTVYFAAQGSGSVDGKVYAFSEANCARVFAWDGYTQKGLDSGVWCPLAYGVDATGEGLVLFGSANPDSSVYAIDAVTGRLVWTYQTYDPNNEDWDVGAGVDVSAPGVNGFADGAAYVEGKSGIFYALDLTDGHLYWENNFGGNGPGQPVVTTDALSTPALSGTTLVFGDINGVYALNAVTGATEWTFAGHEDVNSSPAIVGPAGAQVVAFGTLGDELDVLSLANGTELFHYATGGGITSSPADTDGNLLIDSKDGFLYDFAAGGGQGPAPTTSVTAPASGATIPNPNGGLTIAGTASAADGVGAVDVEVQEGGSTGPWFNQGADAYLPGYAVARATVAQPGATTTGWSLTIPVPSQGGTYSVMAEAVGVQGVADGTALSSSPGPAKSTFTVGESSDVPHLSASPARVEPGGSTVVSGSGFGAGEPVTLTLAVPGASIATIGAGSATPTGTIAITAQLPTDVRFGANTITATGGTTGRTGLLSVYLANDDFQLGYGPLHQDFEVNDPVVNDSQATSTSELFTNAWTDHTAGPIDATPAVVRGSVFVGDESGAFEAVDEVTGARRWSTTLGSAIESSPAVTAGDVIVGDDGGSLTALNTRTGATVWTAALAGQVRSASVVAGGTVYVGTTAGLLYAVAPTTGSIRWSRTIGGPVLSPPAVDTAAREVVVGDQGGDVTAFTPAGKTLWTATAPSPVAGNPLVASGLVVVATTGGTVEALVESSGHLKWTATPGGPVSAAPGLLGQTLVVGSEDGNLYHLNLATGAKGASQATGSPISGLALCQGIAVVVSPSSTVEALRQPAGVRVSWRLKVSGAVDGAPVILNGDLFVGDSASELLGFSALGSPMI